MPGLHTQELAADPYVGICRCSCDSLFLDVGALQSSNELCSHARIRHSSGQGWPYLFIHSFGFISRHFAQMGAQAGSQHN